jgi:hypothetical protein
MRRICACLALALLFLFASPAGAASGRVIKVLPFFLDLKGRHALTPSLYERDAYQLQLGQNPEKRSGIMFDVHWKTKGAPASPLRLRVELRGILQGKAPRETMLETMIEGVGHSRGWTELKLTGQKYADFGEVTCWRATLWEGDRLLDEQRSFLW